MPLMLMDFFSNTQPDFDFQTEQRKFMADQYYPLEFGSYDKDKMHAMQYSTEDAIAGTVLIYKRADVRDSEYTVKLNGLDTTKTYSIYDIDTPENIHTKTGKELMEEGLTISLPAGEKAIFLMFNANIT